MENASKALIIAGAILLAILLISLGIMIFNQASNTVSNSGMSEAEITAFNNKFTKYEGKQSGNMVKSMIQEVLATNAAQGNKDAGIQVTINGQTPGQNATSSVDKNKMYTVKLTYTNGRVKDVSYN